MVIACRILTLLLAAAPTRIVSTAPSITEILFALGLGDRVVGVTTYCRYPPEAAAKPKIGDYLRPNLELILAARPDLVILERTGVRQADRWPGLGAPVLEVDDGNLAGIFDAIARIGRAAGAPERAEALIAKIRAELEAVRRRVAGRPRPRTLVVLGRTPGRLEGIVVAGRNSYLDELIAAAGGQNIFSDSVSAYAKVPLETILARNPEVIVDLGDMADPETFSPRRRQEVVALWARRPELAAVRQGRVYAVASSAFLVPGPRVGEAARVLAELLHPER